ncbi:MAG: FkbM family methyltransferase [Hyphomicrobiaceae bacterium]|nr:FkbM family methyltransferase [Hyphomicrobiaceae bacterium]
MTIEYRALLARIEQLEHLIAKRLPHRSPIYIGNHEAIAQLHTGHKIYVDTRDVGICSHLMWEGRWEPWIEREMMPHIKPGMHVLDIGANFGYYTLLFAATVGATGNVQAFEANPAICQYLRKSISVNGFEPTTTLHNIAVSDQRGSSAFSFDPAYSGGGALGSRSGGNVETIDVTTAPLSDFAVDARPVNAIKIDVEGAEPLVLSGGASIFTSPHLSTIIMEFAPRSLARLRPPEAIVDEFIARGFRASLLEPSGPIPVADGKATVDFVGRGMSYLMLLKP